MPSASPPDVGNGCAFPQATFKNLGLRPLHLTHNSLNILRLLHLHISLRPQNESHCRGGSQQPRSRCDTICLLKTKLNITKDVLRCSSLYSQSQSPYSQLASTIR